MRAHLLCFLGMVVFTFSTYGAKKTPIKSLDKTPKSLFLIKKAKINANVGEPQFNQTEAQLRMITNDDNLKNYKKFE